MHVRTVADSKSSGGCSPDVPRRGAVTVTASPYDAPLSDLREDIENIAVWIGIWENRKEPNAFAKRCAADAVDAIDAALRDLYQIRGRLTAEIRQADDATAARADALLARTEPVRVSRIGHPNRNHP